MGQRIPVLPIWDGFSTQTKSWDAYHLPTSDSDFATIHSSKELKDEFYPSSRGGIMVYYASPCLESALGFGLDFNPFPLILNTPPLQKKKLLISGPIPFKAFKVSFLEVSNVGLESYKPVVH